MKQGAVGGEWEGRGEPGGEWEGKGWGIGISGEWESWGEVQLSPVVPLLVEF